MNNFRITFLGRELNSIGIFYLITASLPLPFNTAAEALLAFDDGDRETWMELSPWEVNYIEKIELI